MLRVVEYVVSTRQVGQNVVTEQLSVDREIPVPPIANVQSRCLRLESQAGELRIRQGRGSRDAMVAKDG